LILDAHHKGLFTYKSLGIDNIEIAHKSGSHDTTIVESAKYPHQCHSPQYQTNNIFTFQYSSFCIGVPTVLLKTLTVVFAVFLKKVFIPSANGCIRNNINIKDTKSKTILYVLEFESFSFSFFCVLFHFNSHTFLFCIGKKLLINSFVFFSI
jgi:hypothetical protein